MKSIGTVQLGKYIRLFPTQRIVVVFLYFFFITACGDSDPSDRKIFDYNLRGTWYSADNSVFDGELFIDYNRITIIGYHEGQTPQHVEDEKRPFRGFIKETPLVGFSEDGIFHIQNAGDWFEIPYHYFTENSGRDKFLRFYFGERMELLRRMP